jgi:AraC-like DNA-binding protein
MRIANSSSSSGKISLRYAGVTPRELRSRTRFQAAARELRTSATAIVDVAASCGFADQSHLTREFRRFAAMTPAAFRSAFSTA